MALHFFVSHMMRLIQLVGPMAKRTEQVNVRLDTEMKAELAAIADKQHRTLSNLILAVLKDYLEAERGKKT